jgi:glycosyltransferase involved in cell wall biosynthesis
MLRSIDEDKGTGIYSRNLIPRLLEVDHETEYVLMYRSPRFVGHFASYPNVTEIHLNLPTKPLWDQVGVPWLARRYGLDLIFNTKATVPLSTATRTVMMLHGSMPFVHPEFFHPLDVAYLRRMMPLYLRKATHVISNSWLTTHDFVTLLGVPCEKVTTIHLAADDQFRPITDPEALARVRAKYRLPEHFILSVTKYFPGKNVPTLIRAYAALPPSLRRGLVLIGPRVSRYLDEMELRGTALEREILTPGWVNQDELPAVYSLAQLFAFPSRYEEFGIPNIEAMSCGCPVVSSNTAGIPEVTGGAALLVPPLDVEALTDAMTRVLSDGELRCSLRQRGLDRARDFDWRTTAVRTAEVFQQVAA